MVNKAVKTAPKANDFASTISICTIIFGTLDVRLEFEGDLLRSFGGQSCSQRVQPAMQSLSRLLRRLKQ
jgi:hypothetical protein